MTKNAWDKYQFIISDEPLQCGCNVKQESFCSEIQPTNDKLMEIAKKISVEFARVDIMDELGKDYSDSEVAQRVAILFEEYYEHSIVYFEHIKDAIPEEVRGYFREMLVKQYQELQAELKGFIK